MKQKIDKTALDEWIEVAEDFKKCVDKMLDEVHSAKQDMMSLRNEILDMIDSGQYIRDEHRIIISAPEIIIGNVNKHGILNEGGSVIIKGTDTQLHGVGDEGVIKILSPIIEQKAINPGIDGEEEVVGYASRITSVAREICLDSQNPLSDDDRGCFFLPPEYENGITISAEEEVTVAAAKKNQSRKKVIEDIASMLDGNIEDTQHSVDDEFNGMKNKAQEIKNKIGQDDILKSTDDLSRANIAAIDMLSAAFEEDMNTYCTHLENYTKMVSKLAELKRQKACLEREKKQITDEDTFKKDTTRCSLTLMGEKVGIMSADGEGNIRTNVDAGITVMGNQISLESAEPKGTLTPAESVGKINLRSRNIALTTEDFSGEFDDRTGDLTSAKFPQVGNITINSKTIDIKAMDYEMEDDNYKETALTKDSSVNIRAEKVKVKTIDAQGKSIGKFSVNSQKISLKSTDIKDYKPELEQDDQQNFKQPEKMESEKVAAESQLFLMSETINIGRKKKDMISKNINIFSDECSVLTSNKLTNVYVGEDGAFEAGVSATNKNVHLAADSSTKISGQKIEAEGEASFNSKITGTDIECKNLKASTAVEAPNIKDGMLVANPAGNNTKPDGTQPKDVKI